MQPHPKFQFNPGKIPDELWSNRPDNVFELFKLVILEMTKVKQPANAWTLKPHL